MITSAAASMANDPVALAIGIGELAGTDTPHALGAAHILAELVIELRRPPREDA